jgi:hypothetical protein
MAWDDTPPTAAELKKSDAWDAAPPTAAELKAAEPENPHDLIPAAKETGKGIWDAVKGAAEHPLDTIGKGLKNAKDAFVPNGDALQAPRHYTDKEMDEGTKGANDAPVMPGVGSAVAALGGGAADAYMRSRKAGNDAETAMKDARNAAVFQGAAIGVGHGVGAGLGQAAKLLPATEGSITNGVASKLAGLVPGGATAEDVHAVYSDPKLRVQARGFNATDAAAELQPQIESAQGALKNAVGDKFGNMEGESLQAGASPEARAGDMASAGDVQSKVKSVNDKIEANPKFYKPLTKEVLNQVQATLESGGPEEHGSASFGQPLDDTTAQARVLRARRNLDDVMNGKDWEKLRMHDREVIQNVRGTLDDSLKQGMSGAPMRQQADALYGDYKTAADDAFKPLNAKSPSGDVAPDVAKIESNIKSQNGRGLNFDNRMEGLQKFMDDHGSEIGEIPEVQKALAAVAKSREVGSMASQLGDLNRAGGPTGIAVKGAARIGLAALHPALIPIQMLLMPVTDPAAYAKLVDTLTPATRAAVQAGASALMQSPAIAKSLISLRVQNNPSQP